MTEKIEIYKIAKVQQLNGNISRATVYDWVKRNILPPPVKLGPRASGWIASEVHASIERRIRASRGEGQQ